MDDLRWDIGGLEKLEKNIKILKTDHPNYDVSKIESETKKYEALFDEYITILNMEEEAPYKLRAAAEFSEN